jgi:23S rRNA A2030 N6-methylase RlmJ
MMDEYGVLLPKEESCPSVATTSAQSFAIFKRKADQLVEQIQAAAVPSGIEAEVCRDIAERQRMGIAKYGMTVANNPLSLKQWLQHAYEEHLDAAVYLRRAIAEIDATIVPLEEGGV